MLNGLSLFSGIGGLDVALSEWVRPIAYCEIDSYCQGVLLSRMANGELPNSPIWDDIKSLGYRILLYAPIDIIYGGFPCQDISIAGIGRGLEGKRSSLFSHIMRLCGEIKPRYVFLENVPAITCRGGEEVGRQFSLLGYDCRWCIISASSCGAIHRRKRWFIFAHANSECEYGLPIRKKQEITSVEQCSESGNEYRWIEDESPLLGVDDDVPFHVDRIRCLGNSVVPKQAKEAFKILSGMK
jgi:DNA (cytosine-5)-methyltransferase 1